MSFKSTGIVFAEKPSIGIEPTRLPDRSRFGSHGTYANITDVQLPSGLWVREFNGATPSYIEIPANQIQLDFTSSAFSILVWIKTTNLTAHNMIFARGNVDADGYIFQINAGGHVQGYTFQAVAQQTSYSAAGQVLINNWYFVGLVRNGASIKPYKNGVDVLAFAGTHINPVTVNRTAKIGIEDDLTTLGFYGQMALLNIYNYPLSAGQIKKKFEKDRPWFGV